jgi:tRNA(Ile)-lysidine synthase TilS/MesJ
MAKIDLDAMSIEEVADLRDLATDRLAEKVAARRAELEAELEKLAQYDKPARKSQVAAPAAKAKKNQENGATGEAARKTDEAKEPVAKAA